MKGIPNRFPRVDSVDSSGKQRRGIHGSQHPAKEQEQISGGHAKIIHLTDLIPWLYILKFLNLSKPFQMEN
jgi:hypothetical protein